MFADVWQRALWQDPRARLHIAAPGLDARQASLDRPAQDRPRPGHGQLSQRYGVFYFFASSCGACDIFSPILKAVSDKYGLSVLAVSMDGGLRRVFPGYMVD
jgi:conjugal transfer pilus assembly protein TraF